MDGWKTIINKSRQRVRPLSYEEEIEIKTDPDLRVFDDPLLQNLLILSRNTDCPEYHNFLKNHIRFIQLECLKDPNPYRRNLPPKKQLPQLVPGRAPLMWLSTGGILTLPLGKFGTSRNQIFTGPSGAGKTNSMYLELLSFSGQAIIVAFDRKGDLARLAQYEQPGEVVILDALKDINLSLSDGLDFLGPEEHVSQITELLNLHLNFGASSRLFANYCYEEIFKRKLSLKSIIYRLENLDAARTSQLGGHRDQLLYTLKSLSRRTGNLFSSAESNFLSRIFTRPRTFIIGTGNMSVDDASLTASWMYRYAYESRRVSRKTQPPIIICVDDGMPFVWGTRSRESEGRRTPIATWSFMGRSLGIGVFVNAQNFSMISPTLRNNTDTVLALGAYGEDASTLTRYMGLNQEQTTYLQRIRPGEGVAIARSQWPLPIYGRIPEVI